MVEAPLVAALVVLLIAYRARAATLVVLILGSIYEAWFTSIDGEHAPRSAVRARTGATATACAYRVINSKYGSGF